MKKPYITDYVKKYNVIDQKVCDDIYASLNQVDDKWKKHSWTVYNGGTEGNTTETHEDDLLVTHELSKEHMEALADALRKTNEMYHMDLEVSTVIAHKFSQPRLNRYVEGTRMAKHHDNIVSLFDSGTGSPTLTYLGCLYNDCEGGEFLMFDDLEIHLEKGDVLVFPSAFMYEHEVLPVTKGERWTFVSWGM